MKLSSINKIIIRINTKLTSQKLEIKDAILARGVDV